MESLHVCPVCELPMLVAPPEMGPVCPACGTEFEVDDRYRSFNQIRQDWIDNGAPWFSARMAPPPNWDSITKPRIVVRIHGPQPPTFHV